MQGICINDQVKFLKNLERNLNKMKKSIFDYFLFYQQGFVDSDKDQAILSYIKENAIINSLELDEDGLVIIEIKIRFKEENLNLDKDILSKFLHYNHLLRDISIADENIGIHGPKLSTIVILKFGLKFYKI